MSNNSISYRELLNFYISQYNSTQSQINGLQNRLDDISENIHNLVMNANNNTIHYIHRNSNRRLNFRNTTTGGGSTATATTTNRTEDNPSVRRGHNTYLDTNTTRDSPQLYPYLNTNVSLNQSSTPFSNLLTTFFNNVEIVPTQQQINNATHNLVFRNIVNPTNDVCPISLERFQPTDNVTQIRWCGHIFKRQELFSWFAHNVRCPVCRYDIRNYTENQSIRTNQSASNDLSGNEVPADPIVEDIDSSDSEIDTEVQNRNSNQINNLSRALADYAINNIFTDLLPLRPLNLPSEQPQTQTYYDSSNNVIMFETIYRR
jgi:Ring finger domain